MQLWNSSTLWAEPTFIVSFMIKEKNRLICLNRIKPLKSPEPELFWTSQYFAFFLSVNIHLLIIPCS